MELPEIDNNYSKILKERLDALPPLPKVAAKALELMTEQDADISQVADLIGKDQVLSAKVIEYANAAYRAVPNPITNIKRAVLTLGIKEVKDILLKVVTSEMIYKLLATSFAELQRKIGIHSYLCAVIAEALCEINYSSKKSEIFLYALLHDIGKLLLMSTFNEDFKIISSHGEELRTLQKEQQHFNLDHCLVGKWIAERWNLPKPILHAIWLHHQSPETLNTLQFVEDKISLYYVMLSNYLSHVRLVDSKSVYEHRDDIDYLCRILGLKEADLNRVVMKSIETIARTGSLFEIEPDPQEIYFGSLQRAVKQLYDLAKVQSNFDKKDQEVSRLRALIRLSAILSESKTLNSIFKAVVTFLKKVVHQDEGMIFLISFGKKKVYISVFNKDVSFYEYGLDQFFEINQTISLNKKFFQIVQNIITKFLNRGEIEKGVTFLEEFKNIVVQSALSEVQRCIYGIILPNDRLNINEFREFLSHTVDIVKNAIEGLSLYEESKKTSESLAIALSKNNEIINELRKAKKGFENLFKYSNDPIVIHSLNGSIKRVNQRFEELFGYSESEVLERNLLGLLDSAGNLKQAEIPSFWLKDEGYVFEASVSKKDGAIIPVQVSSRIVSREEGLVQSIIRDLSAEKEAAERLRLEKERLSVTLSSLGDGVIATDKDGLIILMNKAAEKITGYSYNEIGFKPLVSVFKVQGSSKENNFLEILLKTIEQRERMSVTEVGNLIDKNGQIHPVTYTISPIIGVEDTLYGTVVVFSDLTERYRLEEELFRAKKFESLALLSGGVAHDFNNILTAISGNISIAKMHLKNPDKAKEKLLIAEKAIERAKELTHQLFSFSKSGTVATKKAVDMEELIKEAVNLGTCGSAVVCELMFGERLWPVECDAGQISQVLNNLIINAKEAMSGGGRLKVSAKNQIIPAGQIPALSPGRYVLIEIQDEGPGIPHDILDRIFDPYFTTKSRGSGLGLSTVWNIVRRHGGTVLVRSTVGQGSVFSVYLPASGERPKSVPESSGVPLVRGHGNVLVMDDEEDLRQVAKEIFETLGYTVFLAENGEEALRILKSEIRFELVILDLTVRGGSGALSIVSQVKAMPNVGFVVVSTGYAADEVISNYKEYGFDLAIAKPYDLTKISEMIITLKGR